MTLDIKNASNLSVTINDTVPEQVQCIFLDINLTVMTVANITGGVCLLPKLTKSQKLKYGLSANGTDIYSGTYEITVFAKEPSVLSSRFGPMGTTIEIEFDRSIEISSISSCEKIFLNITQLGKDAACKWNSDTTLSITVGKGDDLILPGSNLTFENDAIKGKQETYAYALKGTIVVQQPSTPLSVKSVIEGPSKIPSCGIVQYSGTNSRGSGGRQLTFKWSIDNIDILGGTEITFTLNVTAKSDSSIYSANSIKLTVKYSPLQVIILGGSERRIGVTDELVLDGSRSTDPDNVANKTEYQWSCKLDDAQECNINGTLFSALTKNWTSILKLDPNSLKSSVNYTFSLNMTKGERQASASVKIISVDGKPPQVLFEPLRNTTKVLTNYSIKLIASITSATDFSVEWRVDNANIADYGYFDINDENNFEEKIKTKVQNTYLCHVIIKPNVLMNGKMYKISLSAKSNSSSVPGMGAIQFKVPASVTSCLLKVPSAYEYLETIEISVSECETDTNAYPLLYQFYSNPPGEEKERLNVRGTQPKVTISGPRVGGQNKMKFSVEVCNKYGMCETYISNNVTVSIDNTKLQQRKNEILDNVDNLLKSQNYFKVLLSLAGILGIQDNARKKRSTEQQQQIPMINQVINVWELAQKKPLSKDETMILSQTNDKLIDDALDDVYLSKVISNLNLLVENFKLNDQSMPDNMFLSSINRVLTASNRNFTLEPSQTLVHNIFTFVGSNEGARKIDSQKFNMVTDTSLLNKPVTLTQKKTIKFIPEKSLEERYINWQCADNRKCQGAVIQLSQFINGSKVFPLMESKFSLISDVIDISLYNPESGGLEKVSDLNTPVMLEIKMDKIDANKIYKCYTWDFTALKWKNLTIAKVNESTSLVQCESQHLSLYAVGEQSKSESSFNGAGSSFVGAIVGGVIGVIIIAIVGIALAKHLKDRSNRVVPFEGTNARNTA
ncbi:uncharacterized protein LOC115232225 [Argonauta hians]